MQVVSKEKNSIEKTVEAYKNYNRVLEDIEACKEMAKDPEMKDFAAEELENLHSERDSLESKLKRLLLPKDPNDEKNVIFEIRGAAGGDEGNIFAGDLYRMYSRWAERTGHTVEIYDMQDGDVLMLENIRFYPEEDANDEKFVYCNLINLSTSRDITLKKTYSDFGTVMNLFTSGKFKQISGDSSLTSATSLEGLMEQYKYHAQYGTFPESYFTPDSLVLVIETNRGSGFFAEFSIRLSEVADCLYYSPIK